MRVLLCGYFAFGTRDNGGQPVKGRELYAALSNYYGNENVEIVETLNWKKHPIKLLFDFLKKSIRTDCIIMLPAQNGVFIFSYLLLFVKKILRKKIFYSVIGGWLSNKTKQKQGLRHRLLHFDGIWVETSSMKFELEQQGFKNICVIPNFKKLRINKKKEYASFSVPFHLCYFARVMKEKGIEDAVKAVNEINDRKKRIICTLDIYGQIDERYAKRFEILKKDFPEYIKYRGMVDSSESVSTLEKYYCLLFPTHYYTEGIPGSLIDALCAGVPVISPRWLNCGDILENGITGIEYEFDNYNAFVFSLDKILSINSSEWLKISNNCIKKAIRFTPQYAVPIIDEELKKL